jgi:anthranilate synthase component 1
MPVSSRWRPGPEAFAALAGRRRLAPVWGELVADTLTPVDAFARMVRDEPGFLLESVEGGERWGRWSFVGRRAVGRVEVRGRRARAEGVAAGVVPPEGGAFGALEALLGAFGSPPERALPPLHGGVVGYLGYDVVREVERLEGRPPDDQGLPEAVLHVIGQLCAVDHWRQRVVLVQHVPVPEDPSAARRAYQLACEELDALVDTLRTPAGLDPFGVQLEGSGEEVPLVPTVPPEDFRRSVLAAKEYIRAGDIFQVVLSSRFDLALRADPFAVYRVLRLVNPSPYLYFFRDPLASVVGASPEPLVRHRAGRVVMRPIAGSSPRGADPEEDQAFEARLRADPKEVAEHVMLVDLARNDVGRVARYGSIRVDELMTVERYSHVMHLTSQVSGVLRPGLGPTDVLRATLPAGTLSGAPKVRAMELIDQLEPTSRGVYGGVVGYVDFSGDLDTAIAIRTLVVRPDGQASVQAGAGIVADSDPDRETQEVRHKAAAVLRAVALAEGAAAVAEPAQGAR